MRLRMEDWMRFAVWVKESSKKSDCFGDFVKAAMAKQIGNDRNPAARKHGRMFGGYGYFGLLPLERMLRDVRMLTITGGTTQTQKNAIANHIFGR